MSERIQDIKRKISESKFGENIAKLTDKQKKLLVILLVAIIAFAIIIAVVLNRGQKNYVPLFTDISSEEAGKISEKLQEDGVDYKYTSSGTIKVPEEVADKERASLAMAGYPKSGFSYDLFTENSGGLTTDSERDTYKLYELQNRIGATIELFDGVKDAKVTIALKPEKKYAIESGKKNEKKSSASVVVVMKDDTVPSKNQAKAIQRLVAKSVPEMKMEDVGVFDGNGNDVSTSDNDMVSQETAKLIEDELKKKVINVLSPFYGAENLRVSAKGKLNMEKIIRERTTYSTPDPDRAKPNERTGIVKEETSTNETSNGGTTVGGVTGTETNADVSEYPRTTSGGAGSYQAESMAKKYLVDQIKEQGEIDPGVLEDVTVSVSINGTFRALTENEVISLIGNATGISPEDQPTNITVVASPFYEEPVKKVKKMTSTEKIIAFVKANLILVIAGLIVLILIIFFVVRQIIKIRKRKRELEEEKNAYILEQQMALAASGKSPISEEESKLLEMQSERGKELRDTVRKFSDQNPEISAQLIKTWLNGGDPDGE